MDKERINPIVAERDDMIGRPSSNIKGDSSHTKTTSKTPVAGISGPWRFIILFALLGLAIGAYLVQVPKFFSFKSVLKLLNSRLNNTDESVTQSGAAMQISISKQGDELKKHWSEIKKLWVANDKNKNKIEKNTQDIKFLASKRAEFETLANEDRNKVQGITENYLGLSADLEALTVSKRAKCSN